MTSRKLLAERIAVIEAANVPALDGDLRAIRRAVDVLGDSRAKTAVRRGVDVRRREERHAWRIIEQRTARALRKLARGEQAA